MRSASSQVRAFTEEIRRVAGLHIQRTRSFASVVRRAKVAFPQAQVRPFLDDTEALRKAILRQAQRCIAVADGFEAQPGASASGPQASVIRMMLESLRAPASDLDHRVTGLAEALAEHGSGRARPKRRR